MGVNGGNPAEEIQMQNTKWTQEVDISPPELPEWFWENPGVTPVQGCVDDAVGDEVLLLVNDPTEHADKLAAVDPFGFSVTCGSIHTTHGSLAYVLFIVPKEDSPTEPHAVWEILFDPLDEEMSAPFDALANQSHWHAVLFGPGPDVLNVFEFSNNYFLGHGLKEVREKSVDSPCTDFEKAVAAAHENYSLEDLYIASALETTPDEA